MALAVRKQQKRTVSAAGLASALARLAAGTRTTTQRRRKRMGKRTSTTVCTRETLQCDFGRVIHVESGFQDLLLHGMSRNHKVLSLASGTSAKLTAKECEQLADMLCPEKPVKKFVARFRYTRVGHYGDREVEFLGFKDRKLHGLEDGQFKQFSIDYIHNITVSQE